MGRYIWLLSAGVSEPARTQPLEVETGRDRVCLSAGRVVSEPVFVPRPGNAASHTEDDGWVLTLEYDPACDASNVTVLDARDLSAGPLPRMIRSPRADDIPRRICPRTDHHKLTGSKKAKSR